MKMILWSQDISDSLKIDSPRIIDILTATFAPDEFQKENLNNLIDVEEYEEEYENEETNSD